MAFKILPSCVQGQGADPPCCSDLWFVANNFNTIQEGGLILGRDLGLRDQLDDEVAVDRDVSEFTKLGFAGFVGSAAISIHCSRRGANRLPLQFDIKRLSLAGTLAGLNLRNPGNLKIN